MLVEEERLSVINIHIENNVVANDGCLNVVHYATILAYEFFTVHSDAIA